MSLNIIWSRDGVGLFLAGGLFVVLVLASRGKDTKISILGPFYTGLFEGRFLEKGRFFDPARVAGGRSRTTLDPAGSTAGFSGFKKRRRRATKIVLSPSAMSTSSAVAATNQGVMRTFSDAEIDKMKLNDLHEKLNERNVRYWMKADKGLRSGSGLRQQLSVFFLF